MNVLEDKLRTALRETGEEIRPHSVPPFHLDQPERPRLPGGSGRNHWGGWLIPLAAAAAVAAVIIASVVIGKAFGGDQAPAAPAAPGGLPRYYVALRFSGHRCCGTDQPLPRTHAVVVDTASGAAVASVGPPPGDTFAGVTGAADDRTFVLGVQRIGSNQPTRFYLLRISTVRPYAPLKTSAPIVTPVPGTIPATPTLMPIGSIPPTATPVSSGAAPSIATLTPTGAVPGTPTFMPTGTVPPTATSVPTGTVPPTATSVPTGTIAPTGTPRPAGSAGARGPRVRLSPLPIPPDRADIFKFALSPNGTSLAVIDMRGLHVTDVTTGAERTWHATLGCFAGGGVLDDSLLSWAANSRDLAVACNTTRRITGIWLLDTATPGTNLIKNSRRLIPGPAAGPDGGPWQQVRLTPDGTTVIGVLFARYPRHSSLTAQELAEFSARTGTLLRVLSYLPADNVAAYEQVLWTSPSGHALVVANSKPHRGIPRRLFFLINAGVLTRHHYTPLPRWSLDTLAAAW